ncbi:ATP-binding protein, partial [Thermus scotoductus]|uniref:ATP-binding protein n=1 Tax=Thermus scotoductus TaxID=37636 RepID=UPI00345314F5
MESVWQPATQDESYEIVRRRLFLPLSAEGFRDRDAVVQAFMRLYREHKGEFPAETAEADYERRMKLAYPIHPELFDRLYGDWSTLEGFQRTRGVLRLMAAVVHTLWTRGDPSLMILPGSLPLDAGGPRYELTRHLSRFQEGFDQVLDTDVDGPNAKAFLLDKERPNLGRHQMARRTARAVFMATAPAAAPIGRPRGVEGIRVRLGVVQPGENPSFVGDALKALTDQLTYFHAEGDRYWFDTRPSLNRLAQDRAAALDPEEVRRELVGRIRAWAKERPSLFAAVHAVPEGSGDVPDEPALRLVVLPPWASHTKGESEAERLAREILDRRGQAPRLYRNTLLFLAAEATSWPDLEAASRGYLAWKSILEEAPSLNLGDMDRAQVRSRLVEAENTLNTRLEEAYRHLLSFHQPDPKAPDLELQALRLQGSGKPLERAASKAKNESLVYTEWHPRFLRDTLERYRFFTARDSQGILPLRWLWEAFCTYPYLPRLKDEEVLLASVRKGVEDGFFGYAERLEGEHPKGVLWREGGFAPNLAGFLLEQEVAERAKAEEKPHPPETTMENTETATPNTLGGGSTIAPITYTHLTLPMIFTPVTSEVIDTTKKQQLIIQ